MYITARGVHATPPCPRFSVPCPHCSAPFPNRSKLATHVSTVHLRAPKTILCDVCGAVFSRRGALQKHLLTFHGGGGDGPSSPRRCPLCPAAFRAVDNLQRHLVSRHANWKRWVCSLCSHRYNHSVDLKRHVVKKHAMILPAIKGSSKKDILDVSRYTGQPWGVMLLSVSNTSSYIY